MNPDALKRISRLRRTGAAIDGFASLGENVIVSPGIRIRNSVIWNDVVLGQGSEVESAVVADGVTASGRITRMALRAETIHDPDILLAIRKLGWPVNRAVAQPLAPRGSARAFTRIMAKRNTAMVVKYSLERSENALYVQNARLLRKIGIRVPATLLDMPGCRMTVMEDAGDLSLREHIAGKSRSATLRLYSNILDSALLLHGYDTRRAPLKRLVLSEPFSPELYRWERNLFAAHCLKDRFGVETRTIGRILKDLGQVARRLAKEPLVLVHRDLQSSNILLLRGKPVFIDFQGMRLGPALYDVASLICDPYVSLPEGIQTALLDHYAGRCGRPEETVKDVFWWAAVQRLIQALGAFGRLSARRETAHFGRHIRPGLAMLGRALEHIDNFPAIRETVNQLQEREDTYETCDSHVNRPGRARMQ